MNAFKKHGALIAVAAGFAAFLFFMFMDVLVYNSNCWMGLHFFKPRYGDPVWIMLVPALTLLFGLIAAGVSFKTGGILSKRVSAVFFIIGAIACFLSCKLFCWSEGISGWDKYYFDLGFGGIFAGIFALVAAAGIVFSMFPQAEEEIEE